MHESLVPAIIREADRLEEALRDDAEVLRAPEIICNERLSREMAAWANAQDADAVIFSLPVFAFPNYTAIAARLIGAPIALNAPRLPELPALGGMQAAAAMIRQIGGQCWKFYGDYDEKHRGDLLNFLRAARAKTRLNGQVYGLIGGRSIGMGSGVAPADRWMSQFGVDVEHIDQLELVRRANLVPTQTAQRAVDWLEKHLRAVEYDGGKLTRESLMRQAAFYIAARDLTRERGLPFIGLKCHYELSEYDVTQCLTAMLLGESEDFDGLREPVVCACEADSDGALTMQVLSLLTGLPTLFLDFRHVCADGMLSLCNCGAVSCWYARQDTVQNNLSQIKAVPVIPKYGGCGAHFTYVAAPCEMTFARLTHTPDSFKMTAFRGEIVSQPEQKTFETAPQWPHAFVRTPLDFELLLARYDSNHIHAVKGNCIDALRNFCGMTNIEFDCLA